MSNYLDKYPGIPIFAGPTPGRLYRNHEINCPEKTYIGQFLLPRELNWALEQAFIGGANSLMGGREKFEEWKKHWEALTLANANTEPILVECEDDDAF